MDKYLLRYKGSIFTMTIVGLLTVVQAIAIIFQAIFLAKAITQMFGGASWQEALKTFALFAIFFVCRHLVQWFKERCALRFAEKTAIDLQQQVLAHIFQEGPSVIGSHGSGNIITLVMEGVSKFRKYIELIIPRMTGILVIPTAILIFIWSKDFMSGITLLLVMPILIIFLILIGIVSKSKIDAQMETYRLLSRHFVDSLRGIVTLKYLGRSKGHEEAIATVSNKYRIATNRSLRYAFLSSFSLDFFSSLSVAVVAVELGLRLINGSILLEPALTILILAPEYFLPVRELGNDYHATMDGKDASEQMHSILERKKNRHDLQSDFELYCDNSSLHLENISFMTGEGQTLLSNLSLHVSGYRRVGIVGSSGAGKSTLIDVLAGFLEPTSGRITMDEGEHGSFSGQSWRNQLTYIPQHPTIFSDTVANNIRMYEPTASDEEVQQAIDRAGLKDVIATFPNELQEAIGQGGRTLSGGEEQRLAFARALLQNRRILLFDEPTAHLDIETEQEIKNMLLPLLEDKLVFFATHRLHWMVQMDEIIVLQNGAIVEQGTHEQLLQLNGVYTELIQLQRGEV